MLGKQEASGFDGATFCKMKKVLILTAGYGEGHNTAALNLRAGMEAISDGNVQVRVVDLLETMYGRVNEWAKRMYLATINRVPLVWEKVYGLVDASSALQENLQWLLPLRQSMEALLAQEKPDAVVSTYPVYNYFIQKIYEQDARRPFAQVTVITDSISVNSIWYRTGSDAFIVANEDTAAVLRERQVPPEKIFVLGFPVSLRFANRHAPRLEPGPGERWRVLYVINSGKRDAPNLIRQLLKLEEIDLTVTVGRNRELRAEVEAVVAESGREAEVLSWTDRLPDLMCAAHLIISKAGGATVQEALAAQTPLIMTQVVPGQEEGNARLLIDHGCGVLAPSPAEIAGLVQSAFANHGALWREWCSNIGGLSRPDAAREIARFVLSAPVPSFPASTL